MRNFPTNRKDARMKPPVSGLMWLEKAIAAKQKLHEGEACNEGDIRYFVLTEIVQLLRQFPGKNLDEVSVSRSPLPIENYTSFEIN